MMKWNTVDPTPDLQKRQIVMKHMSTSYEFDDMYTHPRTDTDYYIGVILADDKGRMFITKLVDWFEDSVIVLYADQPLTIDGNEFAFPATSIYPESGQVAYFITNGNARGEPVVQWAWALLD